MHEAGDRLQRRLQRHRGDRLLHRLQRQRGPVVHAVVREVHGAEQRAEQLAEVVIVGLLLEVQAAAVVEVRGELDRVASAQFLSESNNKFH